MSSPGCAADAVGGLDAAMTVVGTRVLRLAPDTTVAPVQQLELVTLVAQAMPQYRAGSVAALAAFRT
jgi:hypothetical protein